MERKFYHINCLDKWSYLDKKIMDDISFSSFLDFCQGFYVVEFKDKICLMN